jgi:two-component system response regulator AtoC
VIVSSGAIGVAVATTSLPTILVVDDESEMRKYIEMALHCCGYNVETAEDGEEVLAFLRSGRNISAVLLDVMMPSRDGFDILDDIRGVSQDIPVIMLSAAASPNKVIKAMKRGATDFLAKPVSQEDLDRALRRALDRSPTQPVDHGAAIVTPINDLMVYGTNPAMQQLRAMVNKVALSDVPVLIQGETGTGKEVIARQIHMRSPRAPKPFIKLNCAAVPADLLESELFGYEKGAFTGAYQRRAGIFEMAEGGTLLLDEIGDLDVRLQAKLLQALQDHEFRRLGGKDNVRVDIRVIAATHRNLKRAIAEGEFRADLYYRLNVLSLYVPAVRNRREDIPALATFLLQRHSNRELAASLLTPQLLDALMEYNWPGNIRELENSLRKLIVLQDPEAMILELRSKAEHTDDPDDEELKPESRRAAAATPPERRLNEMSLAEQRSTIQAALDATRWNRKQAAANLSIDYKALLYKMRKLQMDE